MRKPQLGIRRHPLPANIERQKTIAEFGYDPVYLKFNSEYLIVAVCTQCKHERTTKYRNARLHSLCLACSNKNNSVESATIRSYKLKAYFQGNPGTRLGIKHTQATRDKLKKTKQERRHLHIGKNAPGYGLRQTHGLRQQYNGVLFRSTWEVAVARHLDTAGIMWQFEPTAFPITYIWEGVLCEGTYRPDFYLPEVDTYWEVKGWWRGDAYVKYTAFREQYPQLAIRLLMFDDLTKEGIHVKR